jgi:hypothetical protein
MRSTVLPPFILHMLHTLPRTTLTRIDIEALFIFIILLIYSDPCGFIFDTVFGTSLE